MENKTKYEVGKSGGRGQAVVFDIETIALDETFQRRMMPKFEEPKTKSAKSAAEKEQEWLDDAALHAERSRVALIGVLEKDVVRWFENDANEADLLTDWWKYVREVPEWQRFVGFACHKFDLPYLIRRSLIHGIEMPYWLLTSRGYISDRIIDLLEIWKAGDRQETISLDRLSKAIGLEGKNGDGSQFGTLWANDKQAALKYCEHDLRLTAKIAERFGV